MKTTFFLLVLITISAQFAHAGGGSLCDGDWCPTCPCDGGDGVLLITPGGNGPTLAELGLTLSVTLVECGGAPRAGFPAEMMSLQLPPGVLLCSPAQADTPSDATGLMTMSGALAGGGWSEALDATQIVVSWMPQSSRNLRFVSPDLNADLKVDLIDLSIFAEDFMSGTYVFRADLEHDEVVNIADLAEFALHLGESCQ